MMVNYKSKTFLICVCMVVFGIVFGVLIGRSHRQGTSEVSVSDEVELQDKQLVKKTAEVERIPVFNINTTKLSDKQREDVLNSKDLLLGGLANLDQAVLTEKVNVGETDLLNVKRIESDTDMEGTNAILTGIRNAINKYQKSVTSLMLKIKEDVEQSSLNSDMQKWILVGLNNGHNYFQATTKGDLIILDQAESAIKVLINNNGKWTVDNGNVVFSDQNSQKMFNEKFSMIAKIKQEQAVLVNQYATRYGTFLNSLQIK